MLFENAKQKNIKAKRKAKLGRKFVASCSQPPVPPSLVLVMRLSGMADKCCYLSYIHDSPYVCIRWSAVWVNSGLSSQGAPEQQNQGSERSVV